MINDTYILFKIIIIGNSGVGKSNIMSRYVQDQFNNELHATIGVEFTTKTLMIDEKDVKLQIWDTAGQERFRAISRSIYNGAKGAFLVYDITNQETFDNIPNWLMELKTYTGPNIPLFLIGNKCDLEHMRAVKKNVADKFARDNGLSYIETSALEKTNIDKVFELLAKNMMDEKKHEIMVNPNKLLLKPIIRLTGSIDTATQQETKEKQCKC